MPVGSSPSPSPSSSPPVAGRRVSLLQRLGPWLVAAVALYPLGRVARRAVAAPGYFLNQLVEGIALGGVYALIALGYTMVYGVLGLINFAHSDVFMVGAYVGIFVAARFGY